MKKDQRKPSVKSTRYKNDTASKSNTGKQTSKKKPIPKTQMTVAQSKRSRPLTPQQRRVLEQRRIRIKKAKRRRRIAVFFATFLLSLIVLVSLSLTVFFKITNFSVAGDTRYSVEEIVKSTSIKADTVNIFRCNLDGVNENIKSTLPYIDSVTIKRRLPNTLVISVKETKARLAAEYGTGYLLLNESCKILEISTDSKGLITVKCPEALEVSEGNTIGFEDELTLENLIKIIKALDNSDLKDIKQIDVRNNNDIKLMYQNRISLVIGTTERIENKFVLAYNAIQNENEISTQEKGKLDLTIPGKAYFSYDINNE